MQKSRGDFGIKQIKAVYAFPRNGRSKDKTKTSLFDVGDTYDVEDAKFDRKTTYVMLDGAWYNAVQFEFFDKSNNQVDIFFDANEVPYAQYRFKEAN